MHRLAPRITQITIAILLIGVAACGDKKADEPEPVPVLSVSPDNIPTFESTPCTYNLSLTSTDTWEAIVDNQGSEWVSIAPANGTKGTTPITISVLENTTFENRSAEIVFKSGTLTKTLSILQKQVNILEIDQKTYQVPSIESNIKIAVKSNLDYSVSTSESWIHITNSKAIKNDSISVVIDKNSTGKNRTANITFKADNISDIVTIHQTAGLFLSVQSIPEFGAEGGVFTLDLSSDTDWNIVLDENLSAWLSSSLTKGSSGSHKISLSASQNSTGAERSGVLTFRSQYESISLNVTQKQNEVLEIPQKSFTVMAKGGDLKISLIANVKYDLSVNESWIHIVNSRNLENNTIYLTIDKNSSGEKRVATITIKGEDLSESIIITQEANLSAGGAIDDMPIEKL